VPSCDAEGNPDQIVSWTDAEADEALPQRVLTVIDGGASASLPPIALENLAELDLTALDADDLGNLREMVLDARRDIASRYDEIAKRAEAELVRRIKEGGGRAIPSFEFEKIELEDVYTQYAFDDAKLRELRGKLSAADADKIGRVIPAHVERVPEQFLRGNTASIKALATKYGRDSEIGRAIDGAMQREKVGEKLVIKRAAPLGGAI
jgi:hypothetical protein